MKINVTLSLASNAQMAALRKCSEVLGNGDDGLPEDPEDLSNVFGILGPCNGCVPEGFIGDDVAHAIIQKFEGLYRTAMHLAEAELAPVANLETVIQPDYEGSTYVCVVDGLGTTSHNCYILDHEKAWCVHHDSLIELADAILQIKARIVGQWKEMHR